MNGIPQPAPSSSLPMSRELLLTLVKTALRTGELRYARRLCTSWLAIYPGDLHVNLLNARALYKDKSSDFRLQALPIAEELCKVDPEFLEAQALLAEINRQTGTTGHMVAKACANALSYGHTITSGKSEHIS